jgi:chemotaxis signal transduction protein
MELQASDPVPHQEAQALLEIPASQARALACVLEYRANAFVALPIHSGVELLEPPIITPVPGMPAFALGLISWQRRHLPLIDIDALLHGKPVRHDSLIDHVLVVAYQAQRNALLEYAALCAPHLVRMTEVTNHQACLLAPHLSGLKAWVLACFKYQGQSVPILDLARIFASPFDRFSIDNTPSMEGSTT